MKIQTVTITPADAERMLATNIKNNRFISQRVVAKYASDITDGRWVNNGECIKITESGNLIDGQHRLSAIIKSGMAVKMAVATGVSDSAMATIDCGKGRSAGDALHMCGHDGGISAAAALRVVYQMQKTGKLSKGFEHISSAKILELIKIHPAVSLSVGVTSRIRGISRSVVAAMHYMFSRSSMEAADFFVARMMDGDALRVGHPIHTLRKRIQANSESRHKMSQEDLVKVMVRAWNAWVAGEELTMFRCDEIKPIDQWPAWRPVGM